MRRSGSLDGPADVFLLDTLGELASAYRTADVALLGGTFAPRGGHNVLEPLRAGLPTVHGPSTSNIGATLRQVASATAGATDAATAALALASFLSDSGRRRAAAAEAEALFLANRGAARRAAEAVLALVRSRS